jgi:phage terminase small subunit
MLLDNQNMPLTQKQLKFYDNITQGMSQVDAYLDAYDAQNMARNTAYVKASELTKNGKIMAKIALFRQQEKEQILQLNRELTIALIEELETLKLAKTKRKISQSLKIIKLLNKLHGYNKPEKIGANLALVV